MLFFCCSDRRRGAVRQQPGLNGLDYLEVVDHGVAPEERQRKLLLHFVKPAEIAALVLDTLVVRITGGERVRDVVVKSVRHLAADPRVLEVEVNQPGDFSTYTLSLEVVGTPGPGQLVLDPMLSAVDFSFKIECESDLDCLPDSVCPCPPEAAVEPQIDYLAKDYESFRQLMLDRLSLVLPDWQPKNAADLGVTLVELFAYVGDYLSYQQDAIATEAYLGTARHRLSVRRHARMVDYRMHDGCNARAWVHVAAGKSGVDLPAHTRLYTHVEGVPAEVAARAEALELGRASAEVFETLHDLTLETALNELHFHTWGERECVLPCGATAATLVGAHGEPIDTLIKPGDVLVLEEVRGPATGNPADADQAHRHAVRVVTVKKAVDPIGKPVGASFAPLDVTQVTWGVPDALPFQLCISSRLSDGRYIDRVSLVRGNVVLADHGRSVSGELVGSVPAPHLGVAAAGEAQRCDPRAAQQLPPRFRPRLDELGLTQAGPPPAEMGRRPEPPPPTPVRPASEAFAWSLDRVLPRVLLTDNDGREWQPAPGRDLLASDEFALELVAEMDDAGVAWLRFGDDRNGSRPAVGASFVADYRVGNGARGNVGAEALRHAIVDLDVHPGLFEAVQAVRNPMPARGGVDAETIEHVRSHAPSAFRVQERAATRDDYAEIVLRHGEVQRAVATVRVAASWRTILIAVDRVGGRDVDAAFKQDLLRFLERYRMAGEDIDIAGPQFVALEVALTVCVEPDFFRADVKRALLEVLSRDSLGDGRRGVFHPDNFTFAQPVLLSPLYAAAQAVRGVRHVRVTGFQQLGDPSSSGLLSGQLPMGRLQIARLDNDPNFPERGVLRLTMEGGR